MQPLTRIWFNPAAFAPNLPLALRAVNLAGSRVDDYHLETVRAASPGNDEIVSGEIGAGTGRSAYIRPDGRR